MAHNTVKHVAGAIALATVIVGSEDVLAGRVKEAAANGAVAGVTAAVAVAASKPNREGGA